MPNAFINPDVVVRGILGALEREVTLPGLIHRDSGSGFTGAKNATVNIAIPATTSARRRGMGTGATRSRDSLAESQVAIQLTENLYKDVPITDEDLTLNITDFGSQVMAPITGAMVRGFEDIVADTMEGASYEVTVPWNGGDPHAVLVDAGRALTDANVPLSGRAVAVGSGLAANLKKSDQFRRYDSAGDSASLALREATIGQVAGFRVVESPGLAPWFAVAFHRTAFALATRAPVVPAGAGWATTLSANGFAMRALRQFDASADGWQDILGFDAFVGCTTVQDHGAFDGFGKWIPAAAPDLTGNTDRKFVRAVAIGSATSS